MMMMMMISLFIVIVIVVNTITILVIILLNRCLNNVKLSVFITIVGEIVYTYVTHAYTCTAYES